MTTDQLAWRLDVGCDYCGRRSDLERYETNRLMDNGFRCTDAHACNQRELAQIRGDDEDDE